MGLLFCVGHFFFFFFFLRRVLEGQGRGNEIFRNCFGKIEGHGEGQPREAWPSEERASLTRVCRAYNK